MSARKRESGKKSDTNWKQLLSYLRNNLIIHPFLFASYAGLSLLASNIAQIQLAGIRATITSVGIALLIVILIRLVLQDLIKAGLIASGVVIMIFSYGHIKNIAQTWSIVGQDVVLAPLFGLFLGGWVYWVLKRSKSPEQVSHYLNWVSLILNIFPIYTIMTFSDQSRLIEQWAPEYLAQAWYNSGVSDVENVIEPPSDPVPDIYYIILDAYTRADVLDELYGYDNSDFVDFLQDRGFYVAEESTSNYVHTDLSIPSSLNMTHLDTMPEFFRQNVDLDDQDTIQSVVGKEFVRNSRVKDILQSQGYTIVTFAGGYGAQFKDADVYVNSPDIEEGNFWQIGFETMLLDTSLAQIYIRLKGGSYGPLQRLFAAHRERVIFTLANLPNFAEAEGNYFVFAHVLSPHVPFVFGPNGEKIEHDDPYTLLDARPGHEENIVYYRDQVHYLNTLVMDTIDQIIEKSDTPPIIILQADHSSKVYDEIDPPETVRMKLLLPILNAYHLPDTDDTLLYPTITPVNSFRVIFNYYFDADLELLEDTSYIFDDNRKEFIDACEIYAGCSSQ